MVKNQKPILNVMIIKTIKLPTLTLFFLFILAACEPVSEISHKDEIKAYHPFSIGLSLKSDEPLPAKDIGARLFEKYNLENTYTVEIIKISEALNQYELFSNNLGAGEYRLVVEVPYKIKLFGLTLIRATKLITHDFLIRKSLPYTCFNFNSQDDLNGWQSSPVYIENKDKPFSKPTCPGLFFVNNDWTVGLKQTTHGGSLFVPVSSECFPKSSNQLSKHNHWTFSIKSPELADNTDWQNLSAINFRVASSAMPLILSPEIHYTLDKSKAGTFNTNKPESRYEISAEGWSVIRHPLEIPKGAIVNKIELHVYGIPEQTVTDGIKSVFFDGICPEHEPTESKPN